MELLFSVISIVAYFFGYPTVAGVEDEYNAIGYRKLQSEVESLRKENHKLKSEIKKITSQMLVIVGEKL